MLPKSCGVCHQLSAAPTISHEEQCTKQAEKAKARVTRNTGPVGRQATQGMWQHTAQTLHLLYAATALQHYDVPQYYKASSPACVDPSLHH